MPPQSSTKTLAPRSGLDPAFAFTLHFVFDRVVVGGCCSSNDSQDCFLFSWETGEVGRRMGSMRSASAMSELLVT